MWGLFLKRLVFELALRQSLVEFRAQGKARPLIQHLDSIAPTDKGAAESDRQAFPVGRIQTPLDTRRQNLGALYGHSTGSHRRAPAA